jgi:hypothetical protein
MSNTVLLIAFVLGLIYLFTKSNKEYFGEGALTQLYYKGQPDVYLTTNTEKYIPEYHWNMYPFNYYKEDIPTRFGKYKYPLYGIYPNNDYTYPFSYV